MQISGSLNKKLIHKSVCWWTRRYSNLHAALEKRTGKKWISWRKNVEQTSSFTVFYVKLFPIGCIKKKGKIKTIASTKIRFGIHEKKLQRYLETEHLPPSTKNSSSYSQRIKVIDKTKKKFKRYCDTHLPCITYEAKFPSSRKMDNEVMWNGFYNVHVGG